MQPGVECVAAAANKLTIHILAAVAEHEREAISERTKAALAAAKARKAARCAPIPPAPCMRVARKAQAVQFAANVLPIIRDIQAAGHTRLNAIAGQLNARKVATANGGQWRHLRVRHILDRPTNGKRRPKVKRQP